MDSTIYVDAAVWPFRGKRWCHMVSEDLEALHAFADSIGLKRSWFHNTPNSPPHYDLSPAYRARALRAGAKELDRAGLTAFIANFRKRQRDGRIK